MGMFYNPQIHNLPTLYWVLAREDGGHALPFIAYESTDKEKAETAMLAFRELNPDTVYNIETYTARAK